MKNIYLRVCSVNIPLLVRPPGGVTGWTSRGLVDQIDVTATMMAIAGLDLTGEYGTPVVGKVRGGPTHGRAQFHKPWVVSENYGFSMIRSDRYKLVVETDTLEPVEFYDLVADPQELENQIDEPTHEDRRAHLKGELEDLMAATP